MSMNRPRNQEPLGQLSMADPYLECERTDWLRPNINWVPRPITNTLGIGPFFPCGDAGLVYGAWARLRKNPGRRSGRRQSANTSLLSGMEEGRHKPCKSGRCQSALVDRGGRHREERATVLVALDPEW